MSHDRTLEEELALCIVDGFHMLSADADGYCNICGQQGGVEFLDEDYLIDDEDTLHG